VADPAAFEPRGDFIDGRFGLPARVSGEIALEDPGDTGSLTTAFPFSNDAVEAAVAAAQRAYPAWRDAAPAERAACLRRFAEVLEAERERLAEVIAREIGKPLWEARTEVTAMIGKVGITLGHGLDLVAERSFDAAGGRVARWRWHSRGALAVLGPFNFPGHLVHGHVVPALATGNSVVIKPSERAPATGQLYAELAARAGFPPGVLNLVQGDGEQGARLAADPSVDGVLFTGSYGVGRRILEATLDQPHKLVALEMGGKNGVLVCEDADLDAAAAAIAFATCVTAGQRCSMTSRVIALRGVADDLVDRLVPIFERIAVGYPLEEGVFMGPVISAAARAHHAAVLEWAREEGAERLVDGGPCEGPRPGHYVRPSLHRVPALSPSRYQTEEHFVPDAFLLEVDSLDEGIAALDATEYGLSSSVFSADRASFERAYRETRVGLINWNTTTVGASSELPFGGVEKSGNDRAAGILSTVYCTYPVASLEVEEPGPPASYPGFPETT
jgi:succinylglutamic semialdehyde dehydrogenase